MLFLSDSAYSSQNQNPTKDHEPSSQLSTFVRTHILDKQKFISQMQQKKTCCSISLLQGITQPEHQRCNDQSKLKILWIQQKIFNNDISLLQGISKPSSSILLHESFRFTTVTFCFATASLVSTPVCWGCHTQHKVSRRIF